MFTSISTARTAARKRQNVLPLQPVKRAGRCWTLLVAPVVDMEALITNMMQYAHVTEEQLQRAGEIPTDLGETLSWPYLCWVREHPLHWHGRTQVLYGDRDALTSRTMIERFRQESGAHLTIMEGGEHWFHTPVQMAVLQTWEETNV